MYITGDPLFIAAEVAYRREVYGVGRPGTRRPRRGRAKGTGWWRRAARSRTDCATGTTTPRPA